MALRFLPVASSLGTLAVTPQSPVFRFTPNRDFVYSRDWDFVLANRGHVNNAGFVNDQDYRKDDPLPLLAVVGNSMIEASMVPYPDTVQGRLAKAFDGKARVYSFAAAGAPLSQYLIWARHAVQDYGAQALVINVVGNDFDESHAAYATHPGFWHYVPDANQQLSLRLSSIARAFSALAVSSALGRYLIFNLQVGVAWIQPEAISVRRPGYGRAALRRQYRRRCRRGAAQPFARGARRLFPRSAGLRGPAAGAYPVCRRRPALPGSRGGFRRHLLRPDAQGLAREGRVIGLRHH